LLQQSPPQVCACGCALDPSFMRASHAAQHHTYMKTTTNPNSQH
jgi:hypothetical protein